MVRWLHEKPALAEASLAPAAAPVVAAADTALSPATTTSFADDGGDRWFLFCWCGCSQALLFCSFCRGMAAVVAVAMATK
uniref:Putative secreted protein n=1 Tax=Ixodes ricinus TaxID=34613 RepID=A0A6B0TVR4_IXORI